MAKKLDFKPFLQYNDITYISNMEAPMYPDWVLKHKTKGTNISCIGGRYYLYEVSSVWNKEKKRAQKITKKYLGRITPEGLIPPKEKQTAEISSAVSVKEFGKRHFTLAQ